MNFFGISLKIIHIKNPFVLPFCIVFRFVSLPRAHISQPNFLDLDPDLKPFLPPKPSASLPPKTPLLIFLSLSLLPLPTLK